VDDRKAKLDALISRRDDLQAGKQRIEGKLDEAQRVLTAVEAECRKRKVKPEQLDAAIRNLERRFDKAVEALTEDIATAEGALSPFLESASDAPSPVGEMKE